MNLRVLKALEAIFSMWGFKENSSFNCDSEILCIFSGFQFNVVKFIRKDDWFLLFCYTNHFTFIWIKFHGPV